MKAYLFSRKFFIFFLILIFSLILRFYKLSEIPGEWFGDISNVHEYTQQVVKGEWPFYFLQSPGPVYHYLIAPFILLTPYAGYLTYKLVSVLVGMVGIWGVYLLAKEIFSRRVGFITAWLMSFSFWPLIWSRLGNSQVAIPAILSFQLYFFIRYIKKGSIKNLIISGVLASLGWYTYPQTFIFAPLFLLSYISFLGITKQMIKRKGEILLVFLFLLVLFLPFLHILKNQPDNFGSGGYVGEKVLPILLMKPEAVIKEGVSSFVKTAGMFATKGDATFRVNVGSSPIIDRLSFVFLVIGILYLIVHKKYLKLFYLFILLCLLVLPAIAPGIPPTEIPSSSRTIAIQPIIYSCIALGMVFFYHLFKIKHKNLHSFLIGFLILTGVVISYSNLLKYFILYPHNLPLQNLAPGKRITDFIDREIPSATVVYFASCCWGPQGEPEPKAVAYTITKSRKYISHENISECTQITVKPAIVIIGPDQKDILKKYDECFPNSPHHIIYTRSHDILFEYLFVP